MDKQTLFLINKTGVVVVYKYCSYPIYCTASQIYIHRGSNCFLLRNVSTEVPQTTSLAISGVHTQSATTLRHYTRAVLISPNTH